MIGIILLNYQTWDVSLRCMKSIADTDTINYQIYFVDNASPNPMPLEVQEYLKSHSEITFVQAKENRGYASGNNIGISKALADGCESLIVTNNDIVFEKSAITEMISSLSKENNIGIVGPKVLDVEGNVQRSRCSMYTGIKEVFQIFTVAKFFFRKKWNRYYCLDQNPLKPDYVYYVSGCCFAMSRECALEVTPLDEGTVLYYEELILGIRMEQKGYRTYYNPESVVIHQHGGTTDKVKPFMYQCIAQSELYYCSKYLRAKKWQLGLLYQYRKVLYWFRKRKNEELRGYWNRFKYEVQIYVEKHEI